MYTLHFLDLFLCLDGSLDCFCALTIVHPAAVFMGVKIPLSYPVFISFVDKPSLLGHLRWCSVAPPCLTLRDPVVCSPPGSSVRGVSQARILERAGISLSRDHPDSGIEAESLAPPQMAGRCFTAEPPGEPHLSHLGSPICGSSHLPNQAKPSPGLGLPDSEPQVCQISRHCSGSVTLTQFFLELKHTGYLTFWVT